MELLVDSRDRTFDEIWFRNGDDTLGTTEMSLPDHALHKTTFIFRNSPAVTEYALADRENTDDCIKYLR